MHSTASGSLRQKPVGDLLREIAAEGLTGLLRVTSPGSIKAIFFESGKPAYAISNIPEDQPDRQLVAMGFATEDQLLKASASAENPQYIPRRLVEMNVLTEQGLRRFLRDSAFRIIVSIFENADGDYSFSKGLTAKHEAQLDCTVADCITAGARAASSQEPLLNSVAPASVTVVCKSQPDEIARSAKLNSIEGYVLATLTAPIAAGDVSALTGLSDVDSRKAVYVLLQLGLVIAAEQPSAAETAPEVEAAAAGETSNGEEELVEAPSGNYSQEEINLALEWGLQDEVWGQESQDGTADLSYQGDVAGQFLPNFESSSSSGNLWKGNAEDTAEISSGDLNLKIENSESWAESGEELAAIQVASAPAPAIAGIPTALNIPSFTSAPALPARVDRASSPINFGDAADTDELQAETSATETPKDDARETPFEIGPSIEDALHEVTLRLNRLANADFYGVLGVTKIASNGSITKAYEAMVKKYGDYKSRWPYEGDLQSRVDLLLSKIGEAYATLGNPEKRRIYDRPVNATTPPAPVIERGNSELHKPSKPQPLPTPIPKPVPLPPPVARPLPPPSSIPILPLPSSNPYESADHFFRQGRAYFERHELHTSAHMFREAIRLEPTKASYHYHLGVTLSVLSQARQLHKHHEGCHVTCNLGGSLTRNQRIRHEAEQHLVRAVELDPANPAIKVRLGLLYKDAGMMKKAEQCFHDVLLLDASNEIARVELGLQDAASIKRKPKRRDYT